MLAYVLLGVAHVAGILLVPFGGLGIWLQLFALVVFAWQTDFNRIGVIPILILVTMGVTAELARALLSAGPVSPDTRRRLGLAGIGGAGFGAVGGLSFPLVGSMFGAFFGAALGALGGAIGARRGTSGRGGMAGLMAATAIRAGASIAIAAFTLLTLLR